MTDYRKRQMPTVYRTDAFKITIYGDDHNPSHFHILTADSAAQVRIADLEIIRGNISKKAYAAAIAWHPKIGKS